MVMHARKPQRMSDGYFEKHQSHSYQSSKYSSKRDYDREASSRSSYRERDNTPTGGSLNNGNSSYRSQSPEIDSPSSRHDIRGDRDRDRDRFSYIQKMRDRDRDVYKKDKYSDKRDRRGNDRETEHRTNHDRIDRRSKLCSSSGDKRSGSDDRDRDRERDIRDGKRDRNDRDRGDRDRERDRDRDRDRNDRERDRERDRNDRSERASCASDWSEHVSSSGKMYYYNCKTEKSQWEKPKEWVEKERTLTRDQHREKDYREKEREREREDRFSRSAAYTKHSSSRGNSRLRWGYENDGGGPPAHRRRIEENQDMDISPGDSTPTSEASYSLTGTPNTAQLNDQSAPLQASSTVVAAGVAAPVLLPNALPRLASHPTNVSVVSSQMHFTTTSSASSGGGGVGGSNVGGGGGGNVNMGNSGAQSNNSNHRKLESVVQQVNLSVSPPVQATTGSHSSSATSNQNDHHMNSNAPGPPKLTAKSLEAMEMNSQQKGGILRQVHGMSVAGASDSNAPLMDVHHTGTVPGVISLRDNSLNSPHYNLSHAHGMSPLNYSKSPVTGTNNSSSVGPYQCSQFGLKTVEGVNPNMIGCPTSLTNASLSSGVVASGNGGGGGGVEGPPTPTQELDISGNTTEQRKLEGTSASLSTLQSCVATAGQAGRGQGPDLSPKLAKYFRADLITHVTNWPADILEKQAQKCSEETHAHGDLQCTKVSAELKSARSLVRITEITATLQEQKIMYLRQQIRLLEELKSQNSFMSDDL